MRYRLLLVGLGLVFIFDCGQILQAQTKNSDALSGFHGQRSGYLGYFNVTDIGLLIGSPQDQNPAPFSFMTYNGINFTEQISASLGIGVEFPSGSYMPIVLDTRYYLRNTMFSPFVQLYGGYAVALDDNLNQGVVYDASSSLMPYYYDYEPFKAKGGWLLNPGFGVRRLIGSDFGIVFSVGYRMQRMYYRAGEDRKRRVAYNRLALKIGITFR